MIACDFGVCVRCAGGDAFFEFVERGQGHLQPKSVMAKMAWASPRTSWLCCMVETPGMLAFSRLRKNS